ncbi:MAG: hypothetical protein HC795_09800 [Coleofasciculaceae cyanobacterium RL_1_1]|nr:hypothetical protein [Coleofasciculaceae cyanobacterium RL_1_1]
MDETNPVHSVLHEINPEITPEIKPKLTPSQPAPRDTRYPSLQAEIRDDILVEDLAPRTTDLSNEPRRSRDRHVEQAIALLEHYSFEIAGGSARSFVAYWADDLPSEWLRLAVLEALYQGRYKAVSVSQILTRWERKQQPQTHFNAEFESLICDQLFAEVETDIETAETAETVETAEATDDTIAAKPAPSEQTKTPAESTSKPLENSVSNLTPVRLPNSSPPSDDAIAPQPTPQNTEDHQDTAQSGDSGDSSESDQSDEPGFSSLHHQRAHPTHIAQFVPEGDSPISDKLRDLARASETEAASPPPLP